MARWVRVAALGGGVGTTTTWLASAGGFPLAVTCMLTVAAVFSAFCAAYFHFHRRSRDDNTGATASTEGSSAENSPARGFAGFKFAHNSPGRALINSSKKLLISLKWGRRKEEDEVKEGDLLWQRRILMGERCQPPDFSGRIFYDDKGNRLSEFPPRSPKLNILNPSSLEQSDAVQHR